MLLIAAGSLWLFLAALPVLADGGPHVSSANSGVSTLASDSCAGCHRAHTAQGAMLLNQPSEEELCLSCHGAAGTGATTDVMTGVQYAIGTNGLRDTGTTLGALRGGGFDQARIDAGNTVRVSYLRNATDVSNRPKVGVGAPENVTSVHIPMPENGNVLPGVAWGNGAAGSGAGPAAELSCASCHNPHGNGQFRILNKIPSATGVVTTWTVKILTATASNDRLTTEISHALQVGDIVTIAGTSTAADGANRVVATVSANYFTLTGIDITADATFAAATVTRTSGVPVTDASLPTAGDTRNYTVMQVKGTEGTESTYLLYASQVETAATAGTFNGIPGNYTATGGDYFARNVPWNPSINNTCDPTVFPLQAGCATANSAPNGRPSTFSAQITAWCASCHTRYFANNNPTLDPTDSPTTTGASWGNPRPGESLFMYQHRTVAGRDCLTCHVSHGSNAAMTGTYSSTYSYPNGMASPSSRLLKVDNRGTCQACHDPTGTVTAGTVLPSPAPVLTVP